jgi:osmotically-inducible protein OsmY
MLVRVGFRDAVVARPVQATPSVANPAASARVDDAALVTRVAEALQQALAPNARIEHYAGEATLRGVTIRVGAREGVVTLSGAVEQADVIPRAQAIARSVPGVRSVESRLVAQGMLDFD